MAILTLQKRMMELGRIRLGGEKGEKQPGRKLDAFRFTSPSKTLLEAVGARYGGKVAPWDSAPDDGYWQVYTDATELHGIFPPVFSEQDGTPTVPLSQWFESWAGGACDRRCDGVTELLSGKPCLCQTLIDKQGEDARVCKPTTRLSFMLPDLPGLGVWRVESRGYHAAIELPGTARVLERAAQEGVFIPMVLRLEKRTVKKPGEKHPRRFVVPVLELPNVTVYQLAAGEVPLVLNAPAGKPERPGLPAGPEPEPEKFNEPEPEHGPPPPLPGTPLETPDPEKIDANGKVVTAAQVKLLWTTIRTRGVPEDRVRAIVEEATGQGSTRAIPADLFEAVLTAVQAEEVESKFRIPESAR